MVRLCKDLEASRTAEASLLRGACDSTDVDALD